MFESVGNSPFLETAMKKYRTAVCYCIDFCYYNDYKR